MTNRAGFIICWLVRRAGEKGGCISYGVDSKICVFLFLLVFVVQQMLSLGRWSENIFRQFQNETSLSPSWCNVNRWTCTDHWPRINSDSKVPLLSASSLFFIPEIDWIACLLLYFCHFLFCISSYNKLLYLEHYSSREKAYFVCLLSSFLQPCKHPQTLTACFLSRATVGRHAVGLRLKSRVEKRSINRLETLCLSCDSTTSLCNHNTWQA